MIQEYKTDVLIAENIAYVEGIYPFVRKLSIQKIQDYKTEFLIVENIA
jgi:hypothetical protein